MVLDMDSVNRSTRPKVRNPLRASLDRSVQLLGLMQLFPIALTTLALTTGVSVGQVQTTVEDCTIDWSEGVIHVMGVGRANFDSSIARPSRNALLKLH